MPKSSLFPLYLSPLEQFFCLDNRPAHPMAFYSVYDFTGVVDRQAFQSAVEEALERHPLLNALVRPAKRNKPCWVAASGNGPKVDWGIYDDPIRPPQGERIDLTNEIGMRIWVRQGPERATATFEFHHACADGIGASRYIGDVLALYGMKVPNDAEPPRLEPLDGEGLRERTNLQVDTWRTKNYLKMFGRGMGTLLGLLRRRPHPLKPAGRSPTRQGDPPLSTSFPGIRNAVIPREEFEAIRAAALEKSVQFNDLLIAALFAALHEWTQTVGDRSARRPLRIMMPTDLRDENSLALPVACLTSYSFLTQDQADCRDHAKLLDNVNRDTTEIKNRRLGVKFSDALAIGLTSGLLKFVVNAPISLASAVVSNIGDPTRRYAARLPRRGGRIVAGNLVLDDITGVPPLRPNTRATFCILTYGRKLTISLRCDAAHFSDEDSERLLQLYVRQLRSYIPAAGLVETA
jgi:hypothetical protein